MKGKEQGMACIDFNWVWLNRAQVGGLNHITIVVCVCGGGGGKMTTRPNSKTESWKGAENGVRKL